MNQTEFNSRPSIQKPELKTLALTWQQNAEDKVAPKKLYVTDWLDTLGKGRNISGFEIVERMDFEWKMNVCKERGMHNVGTVDDPYANVLSHLQDYAKNAVFFTRVKEWDYPNVKHGTHDVDVVLNIIDGGALTPMLDAKRYNEARSIDINTEVWYPPAIYMIPKDKLNPQQLKAALS